MASLYIAVAGNIGTGKTTLTSLLSERYGWRPHYEAVAENPYLSDFYGDMPRWALPLQIRFLTTRFRDHRAIETHNGSAIQDRTIYEDAEIFAWNLHATGKMDDRDWATYGELAEVLCEALRPPDVLVFVRKSVPKLLERIAERGREFEKNIPVDYLTRLNDRYDAWFDTYQRGRKLVIDSDALDFLREPEHFDTLAQKVLASLEQPDLFLRPGG